MSSEDNVKTHLDHMNHLDFEGWDKGDWEGAFSDFHTDDVFVQWRGMPDTRGLAEHIVVCRKLADENGGKPFQITGHPIGFGEGDWTCVVGDLEDGTRMVTVGKWRDGKLAEEYIWT